MMRRCIAVIVGVFIWAATATQASAQDGQVAPSGSPTPLASTPFYRAYSDHPVIEQATESLEMTSSVRSVLADSASSLPLRLAIVNALGSHTLPDGYTRSWWQSLGHETAPSAEANANSPKITPDFFLLYAYMTALEQPLRPEAAEPIVTLGVNALPGSMSAQLTGLLIRSQRLLFDGEWCEIWKSTESVLAAEELERDIRPGAIAIIAAFLGTYEQDCR